MSRGLQNAAFGGTLVATGAALAWVGAAWESPIVALLGAVYGVVGAVAVFLQYSDADGDEPAVKADGGGTLTLASAPSFVREELPPSAKLVWLYLADQGESTLDDVVAGTQLSPRTARNALTRLERYEAVTKRPVDSGRRRLTYAVSAPGDEAATDEPTTEAADDGRPRADA